METTEEWLPSYGKHILVNIINLNDTFRRKTAFFDEIPIK